MSNCNVSATCDSVSMQFSTLFNTIIIRHDVQDVINK